MAEYLIELNGSIENGDSLHPSGTRAFATFDINTLSGNLQIGTFPNSSFDSDISATNLSITNLFASIGGVPVLSMSSITGSMGSDCGGCTIENPGAQSWEPLLTVGNAGPFASPFAWDFRSGAILTTNTLDPIMALLNGYTGSSGSLVSYTVDWDNGSHQIINLTPGTPVPEPSSLALFGAALLAFVCYRVIRHHSTRRSPGRARASVTAGSVAL